MFFGASLPIDPQESDDVWDALDLAGAAYEEPSDSLLAREQAAFDAPDTLDHLIEIADMVTMQAAQRLIRVNVLRREARADAARERDPPSVRARVL